MIKDNLLFFYPAERLVNHGLGTIAAEARQAFGSAQLAAHALGWKPQELEQLLKQPTLPDLGGRVVFAIAFRDLMGRSLAEIRRDIRRRLVIWALGRFGPTWSDYQIANFVGVEVTRVRRIRHQELG